MSISYAVSLGSFGGYMTSPLAEAFRKSHLQLVELSFTPYTESGEESARSAQETKKLIRDGVIRTASVHLPFYGNNQSWDPSEPDETARKEIVGRFIRLIRDNAEMMGPNVTLHASNEPPLSEHPKRIDQVCRSIEEMLPLAGELGFSINVEYLPRTCVGNSAEELKAIVSRFDRTHVGINVDVNHIMNRWRELPDIIRELSFAIRAFHISDYDGVDEMHWFPGQGLIRWPEVMKAIRAIDHDVLLIFETLFQLGVKASHVADPFFAIRQTEQSCWFLENCEELVPRINAFKIPGNEQKGPIGSCGETRKN